MRGDLIASIRVVPNEQALLSATSRINSQNYPTIMQKNF